MDEKNSALVRSAPQLNPPFLVLLEGLFIGYLNERGGVYQVGVLPAAGHQFAISILEFEIQTIGGLPFLLPVGEQDIVFHDVPPGSRMWSFFVDPAAPPVEPYYSGEFTDRFHVPGLGNELSPLGKDFHWALNLDSPIDFPQHAGALTAQPNVLNPIISIRNGLLHNRGLIRNVHRKREGQPLEVLGAISERIAVNLETTNLPANAKVILKIDGGREIFNLPYQSNRRYLITIRNTPPQDQVTSTMLRSHFQLFYLALHAAPDKRYDLRPAPASASEDLLLQSDAFNHSELLDVDIRSGAIPKRGAPSPYRCGIGNIGTPLT